MDLLAAVLLWAGVAQLARAAGGGLGAVVRSRFLPPYYPDGATRFPLRNRPGVYLIRDASGVVYVGSSRVDTYKALYRHFQAWNDASRDRPRVVYDPEAVTVRVLYTSTPAQALALERALIVRLRPRDNPDKLISFELTEAGADVLEAAASAPWNDPSEPPPF